MTCKVSDIFEINYGNSLPLNNLIKDKNGINFISRQSKNNGCSSKVKELENVKPYDPGLITVVLNGNNVLDSFVQPHAFYTAYHVMVLAPKSEMDLKEKIFYCMCLRKNKYRYSYGRQANTTLQNIPIPSKDKIPTWVYNTPLPSAPSKDSVNQESVLLNTASWKTFKYSGKDGIFIIKGGYYNKKPDHTEEGNIPFISAAGQTNGITDYYSLYDIENNHKDEGSIAHPLSHKLFKGNCITVVNNGSAVGSAFYQENDFTCSHDINILYLKNKEYNKYIALFICTLIRLENYRWTYGRKWRPVRMHKSEIKLPTDTEGAPDWNFMELFIKSLPYSQNLD